MTQSLESLIQQVAAGKVLVKARRLASIIGQIISMQGGIGPLVRLRTRYLYNCLEKRASWDSCVLVDSLALSDLFYWQSNVFALNGTPLSRDDKCQEIVYTDASLRGYGGYLVNQDGHETRGTWSFQESLKSSTWRELEAVYRVLKSAEAKLEGV